MSKTYKNDLAGAGGELQIIGRSPRHRPYLIVRDAGGRAVWSKGRRQHLIALALSILDAIDYRRERQ